MTQFCRSLVYKTKLRSIKGQRILIPAVTLFYIFHQYDNDDEYSCITYIRGMEIHKTMWASEIKILTPLEILAASDELAVLVDQLQLDYHCKI